MQVRPKSVITTPPAGREPVPTAVPKPVISPSGASSDVGTRWGNSACVVTVTPRDQLAQLTQIVLRTAHADGELRHPGGRQIVRQVADALERADHVLDGRRVGAYVG